MQFSNNGLFKTNTKKRVLHFKGQVYHTFLLLLSNKILILQRKREFNDFGQQSIIKVWRHTQKVITNLTAY